MEETEIVKTQDIDEAKLKKKTAIGIILILAFLIICIIVAIQNSSVANQAVGKWNDTDITISIEKDGTFQFNFVPVQYGYFIDASGNWEEDSSSGTQTIYHLTSTKMRFSKATDSQNAESTLLCSFNIDSDDPNVAVASFTVTYNGRSSDKITMNLRRSE